MPGNSSVLDEQKQLVRATKKVLAVIAKDVRDGLLETVGVESSLSFDEDKCSVVLELPEKTDAESIARAIDAENVEAWCDSNGKVRVGIGPWLSIKEVDQTVLGTIKVVHVLLGLHAAEAAKPQTFVQKLLMAFNEVILIQKDIEKKKNEV